MNGKKPKDRHIEVRGYRPASSLNFYVVLRWRLLVFTFSIVFVVRMFQLSSREIKNRVYKESESLMGYVEDVVACKKYITGINKRRYYLVCDDCLPQHMILCKLEG